MNKPIRILLDLDGVIVNFSRQYHTITGEYPVDVYGAHGNMSAEQREYKDSLFDRYIDQSGFVHAPMMDDAPLLLDTLYMLRDSGLIDRLEICTSAGGAKREYEVREQKLRWLYMNGLGLLKAHVVTNGKKKAGVIDPRFTDILIDDTQFVADNFTAAGGISILHTSAKDTLRQLIKN